MDDSRLSKPLLATFRTSPTSTSAELNDRIRQSVRLYAAFPIQIIQSYFLTLNACWRYDSGAISPPCTAWFCYIHTTRKQQPA